MPINMVKLPTSRKDLYFRVAKGHFATSRSHTNYYIDITVQKTRLSEATALAQEFVEMYRYKAPVDTILCLDGTEVIGTCIANEMTRMELANMNLHQTVYIVTPEHTSGSQLIFRENILPMIKGKNVLIRKYIGYRGGVLDRDRVRGLSHNVRIQSQGSAGLRKLRLSQMPHVPRGKKDRRAHKLLRILKALRSAKRNKKQGCAHPPVLVPRSSRAVRLPAEVLKQQSFSFFAKQFKLCGQLTELKQKM